jgi:RNA polymerase sigma-70 factor (ECF subfamily)
MNSGAEAQLVEALRRGELAAYRQLYEVFAPRLQRTVERIYRDPRIAEDAIQSTFLIVFQKVDGFDGRAALLTWMTRIAIREAQRLAQSGRPRPAQVPAPTVTLTPEAHNASRQLLRHLESLIAALPIEKRTALLLFQVEGFSVQEIADITGEPRGTVLARLSRTRAELREALSRWSESGSPPAAKAQADEEGGEDE